MKAVILAGGFGTRLRPITDDLPKPLVPVRGKPCMEHIIELLARHGVDEAVITLHYLGDRIKERFGSESHGVRLRYIFEQVPLGTAGCVKAAQEFLHGDFFVISGDAYCDMDIGAAARFHRSHEADLTVVLGEAEDASRYGVAVTDRDGRILSFAEKTAGAVASRSVNTGIYVLDERVLELIPPGEKYDFSRDLFPRMLKEGMRLYGCAGKGSWRDIGSIGEFYKSNVSGGGFSVGRSCTISPTASVAGSVIFDNVTVGDGARVDGSVICEGAVVCRGVSVPRGSIIASGSVVDGSFDFGSVRSPELFDAADGGRAHN